MGIKGRLKKDQFGFSMPVNAPLYQEPPFYYKDVRSATFRYETTEELADIVPAPLELTDPPTASLAIVKYPRSTFGPYKEAILFAHVLFQGDPFLYQPHIFTDTEPPLAGGREIWGIPKKLAHVEFVHENEQVMGYVERPEELRLCSGTMRPEEPVDPDGIESMSPMSMRVIPSLEPGAEPEMAQLIEIFVDQDFKEVWVGPGSCSFTGNSELDPWHKAPVVEMVECAFSIYDMELGWGEVLHTL